MMLMQMWPTSAARRSLLWKPWSALAAPMALMALPMARMSPQAVAMEDARAIVAADTVRATSPVAMASTFRYRATKRTRLTLISPGRGLSL